MDAEGSKEKAALPFEEALAKLEAIVAEMEAGRLTLEESMTRFEEGMSLTSYCGEKLGETEKRIEILLKNAQGAPEWQEEQEEQEEKDEDAPF